MCKKSIIALLAALPLLFACGNPAPKTGDMRRVPELLAAVPSDALAVICYDRLEEGLPLLDSTSVLHKLNLTAFKQSQMALSLCYNGSLVPVLALDAGRAEADSASAVSALLAQASVLKLQAQYVRPDAETKRRGFVLITPSDAQLTAVRRHLTEHTSILDAPGFRQALAAAAGRDFVAFRGGGAPERLAPKSWLRDFFPRRPLTRFLGSVANWTVLTSTAGGFDVVPVCEQDDAFYANILGSLPPGPRGHALRPGAARVASTDPRGRGPLAGRFRPADRVPEAAGGAPPGEREGPAQVGVGAERPRSRARALRRRGRGPGPPRQACDGARTS